MSALGAAMIGAILVSGAQPAAAYTTEQFATLANLSASNPTRLSTQASHNGGKAYLRSVGLGGTRIQTLQGSGVVWTTNSSSNTYVHHYHSTIYTNSKIQCRWVNDGSNVGATADCWRYKS